MAGLASIVSRISSINCLISRLIFFTGWDGVRKIFSCLPMVRISLTAILIQPQVRKHANCPLQERILQCNLPCNRALTAIQSWAGGEDGEKESPERQL